MLEGRIKFMNMETNLNTNINKAAIGYIYSYEGIS